MWQLYFESLILMLMLATATWVLSLIRKDVSIVDSLWSLMFLSAGLYVYLMAEEVTARTWLILALLLAWSLRLSIFLTIRNWGKPEDRRYKEIRANNSPHFEIKSLVIVFWLQALIAWLVFFGLLPSILSTSEFSGLDWLALGLWALGMMFEVVADHQLYQFQSKASNKVSVLQDGLWRYSRHPNYFGEFLVWWGFYLFALSSGAWWTILSPAIMTILLLKISGVGLMEKGMTKRRPNYQEYIEKTNAFFPWLPKEQIQISMEVNKS